MRYTQLGRTDLQVSRICLGTMTWGEQNTEAEAHEQLDYAVDQGINFIDTAEMYPVPPRLETQGLTEQYLGTWLKKRKNREQVMIASKVTGPSIFYSYIRSGGTHLTKQHIREAIEGNLKRLQTDYIDLYQIHWPERNTNYFGQLGYQHRDEEQNLPIAETLGVLDELVQEGKIRHIGLSNETPWGVMSYLQLAEKESLPRIVSIQNPYNLLNRSFEVGLAEISHREDVGLLAYSPLAFGTLSGKYLNKAQPAKARITLFERFSRYSNPQGQEAITAYVELAKEFHLSPTQMALAFVTSRSFLTSTIIGATTMEQLKSNIHSIDLTLPPEILQAIENIHKIYSNPCP
ncbi:MAG: NADP(H)-dependent aldo-keto reductase [SAR324 cluster bacterium]|uniref:Protein tas n=1 Tax=SAR324 cluster bacterium TaxID=2024889 RepID=A0A2A4SRQ1_9DELT|nr:MAG: NADP(H)-dependent aldo-keto reductase [SAR324 cluster bacterium]